MLKLIVLSPLVGAAIIGLGGRRWSERLIGTVGCATVGLSTVLAFYVFFARLLPLDPEHRLIFEPFYNWIASGRLHADFGFQLDPLSGVYILFVTFVGFWIHVFGIGYMHGDSGYYRFFAYMNLFMFMMLLLVLADNFLLMFVGWEGVGLCSYLLIGHYFTRQYAADAAKKAFIVNRIGDFGFALGIIFIFATFHTIRFTEVMARAAHMPTEALWTMGTLTAICLLLFVGATGKSAQIPLYVWLPDAMAGPTPVSALIHAATMVTAGVYMVARTSQMYTRSLTALFIVALIGGLTAFFAATIALGQDNIKKVLAYSTISQLGYMFMACGAGAFIAGIFHVVTHAFFKALLFLGAGSVIIALHHNEDMRQMGGLKKYMPITYKTFVIAWLAIAGVFPLAGFFSKDDILWRTANSAVLPPGWGRALWFLGVITAILTAIYMTRLVVMTFHGEERFGHAETGSATGHHAGHLSPRESPPTMTIPLIVLAVLSVVGGWIGIPEGLSGGRIPNWIEHFLHPVIATASASQAATEATGHGLEIGLTIGTLLLIVASLVWAYRFYQRQPLWQPPGVLVHKYWVDEVYDHLFVRPIKTISTVLLWQIFDVRIIDGAVNGTAALVRAGGRALRHIQTGAVRSYVVMIFLGALIIITYFMLAGQ
ncbi:MAG: NADH-quinone oxidoreductase subunit L [Acidobacteria bacterium]|nr:MAG: NADH-quinone oxidoreductase subunit L [Acidobacteriota bacterium]